MFANQRIDIPCPTCGYQLAISIDELEKNTEQYCPLCGSCIDVNADEFTQLLNNIENEFSSVMGDITINLNF